MVSVKIFKNDSHWFGVESYRIDAVPIEVEGAENHVGRQVALKLCHDALNLQGSGFGQTALELLRFTVIKPVRHVVHILSIRSYDVSQQVLSVRLSAMGKAFLSSARKAGYVVSEMGYEEYRKVTGSLITAKSCWALAKSDEAVFSSFRAPTLVESVDSKTLYEALEAAPGTALCVQVIPTLLTAAEREKISDEAARASVAADGAGSGVRDTLAAEAAERWKKSSLNSSRPCARVNLLAIGDMTGAALLETRLKSSIKGGLFQTVPLPEYRNVPFFSQPWVISRIIAEKAPSLLRTGWTVDEASCALELPLFQDSWFTGCRPNPLSLVPEVEVLPRGLSGADGGVRLGRTIASRQQVTLPFQSLVLHTGVFGMSGSGKTTLMKWLIRQLEKAGIPVLVLEPVKMEFRDLVQGLGGRVFTVERPTLPLTMNPFEPPAGVPLGLYKPSLMSALKAAITLPDPLPALFERAVSEAYLLNGWTDSSTSGDGKAAAFDMADFIHIFKGVILQSEYSDEVKGNLMSGGAFRLASLLERCPRTFDALHSTPVVDLLSKTTVLEMGSLEPEQRSLVTALTLIRILAYLKVTRRSGQGLKNVILLDEAHALLDQGEGSTEEERALHSAMNQMFINLLTEIRAYGVGIILADQSPSRIGPTVVDNLGNLVTFRLSGDEARMMQSRLGCKNNNLEAALPQLKVGQFLLKTAALHSPLAVKMEYAPSQTQHVTDDQIAKAQVRYFASRAKLYRPFAFCEAAGCTYCSSRVREEARVLASKLFYSKREALREPQNIAEGLIHIPNAMRSRVDACSSVDFEKLCSCVSVHLLRKCSMENGICIASQSAGLLLSDMKKRIRG